MNYKQNCFAFTAQNGKGACMALKSCNCDSCVFYKTKEEAHNASERAKERNERIRGEKK